MKKSKIIKTGLGVAALAGVGVSMVRAATTYKAKPIENVNLGKEEKVDVERFIKNLSDAIKIPTIANRDESLVDWAPFDEFHAMLEKAYPFKGDSIWMQKGVVTGAVAQARKYFLHNNLKRAFEDAGVTAATLSIDAKGEITVEAADGGDLEQLKQTLTNKSDLFQTVYCKGTGTTVMPDSPEEKRFLVTEVRWMLWKKYGLKIDDLIDENGQVKELPESMRETKDAEKYFSDLILYGWKHGMTEDTLLGKLTYVNGKLYVR